MVSFVPHRGAVVSELSHEEIAEITEIRVCLETMAIRESLPLLDEEDLERAEETLHTIDHEKDLVLHWGELNWRFHATHFAPADRPRLLALIKAEHDAFERYIRVHLALSDYEKPQREHYELLEICRRKDADAAQKFLAQHIRNTGNLLFAHIKKTPNRTEKTTPERRQRPNVPKTPALDVGYNVQYFPPRERWSCGGG